MLGIYNVYFLLVVASPAPTTDNNAAAIIAVIMPMLNPGTTRLVTHMSAALIISERISKINGLDFLIRLCKIGPINELIKPNTTATTIMVSHVPCPQEPVNVMSMNGSRVRNDIPHKISALTSQLIKILTT